MKTMKTKIELQIQCFRNRIIKRTFTIGENLTFGSKIPDDDGVHNISFSKKPFHVKKGDKTINVSTGHGLITQIFFIKHPVLDFPGKFQGSF